MVISEPVDGKEATGLLSPIARSLPLCLLPTRESTVEGTGVQREGTSQGPAGSRGQAWTGAWAS